MKTWDVIVVGGGIIGLTLAIALRKRGAAVLVIERGEPGREASQAAAGMLADCMLEAPAVLQPLATASAGMYPEFVHELQDESELNADLREQGTLVFPPPEHVRERPGFMTEALLPAPLAEMEPALGNTERAAFYLKERSVDPRALTGAALKAAKHRGVDLSSGATVSKVLLGDGRVIGVASDRTSYSAPAVVNCAGAWSGQIAPYKFPTCPVKGQMLAVAGVRRDLIRHVLRSPDVYLVPRSDGRILIGATLENAGFDKRTNAATIQRLHDAAIALIPELAEARILEAWAGLRPGTVDNLPILGATATPGYFVATGHYRDGILLAPVTAQAMAEVISGGKPQQDLSSFSPLRFQL